MSSSSVTSESFSNARYLDRVQNLVTRSLSRLSSGSRIVTPSDDAQGVGLGEKLTGQNQRIQAAETNVQNATSYLQSTDGFIKSMSDMVTRMSELSLLATDVMKNGGDIALYQTEFTALQEQLRGIVGGTTAEIGGTTSITKPMGTFNGLVLFGPNPGGMPVATSETPGENVALPEINFRDGSMLELIQQDGAGNYTLHLTDSTAISKITAGLQDLADERATVGAVSRRFELIASNLKKRGERMTSTLSAINDVDVATESTRLSKMQALAQSGTAMLAQANQSPRAVLRLLQGS